MFKLLSLLPTIFLAVSVHAMAEPFEVNCNIQSITNSYFDHDDRRDEFKSRREFISVYEIDSPSKSVLLKSQIGTSYPSNKAPEPFNYTMQEYYQDVRVLNDNLVVFCSDEKFKCSEGIINDRNNRTTVNVSPVVLNLRSGKISYSYNQITKNGNNTLFLETVSTGECKKL